MMKVTGTKVERVISVYNGNSRNKHQKQNKDKTFEEVLKIENEKAKSAVVLDLSGSMW